MNSYWNQGDELSLGLGAVLGGTHSTNTLNIAAFFFAQDQSPQGGCVDVTFTHLLQRSDTPAGGWCPSGGQVTTYTSEVNACDNGQDSLLSGGGVLGGGSLPYRRYWGSQLTVSVGGQSVNSEGGCARILSESECVLQ